MSRSTRVLATAAVLLLGLAACSDDADTRSETAGLPDTAVALQAHEWVLDGGDSSPTLSGASVTLAFRDDRVEGEGPCNVYFGPVSIDGDDLEIGDLATTQRGCEPLVADLEGTWLEALGAVTAAEVDDDGERLELTGPDGLRLVFDAYDAEDHITGEWEVVDVASDDAVESLPEPLPVLRIGPGDDLTVDAPCGTVTATWTVAVDAFEATDVVSGCAGDGGEGAALGSAFSAARRVEVGPDRLILIDEDDHITLVAVRGEREP